MKIKITEASRVTLGAGMVLDLDDAQALQLIQLGRAAKVQDQKPATKSTKKSAK